MRLFAKLSVLILAGVAAPLANAEFFNTPVNGTQVAAGSYYNVTWDLEVVNALFSGANVTNATNSGADDAQPTNAADMRRWIKVIRRQDANSTSASDTETSSTASATSGGMDGSSESATSSATGTETGAGATPTPGMNQSWTPAQCTRGIPAVLNGTVSVCSILQIIPVGHHCTPALFSTVNLDVTTGWFSVPVPYASTADEYAIELIFQDGAYESEFFSPPFSIVTPAPAS